MFRNEARTVEAHLRSKLEQKNQKIGQLKEYQKTGKIKTFKNIFVSFNF